MSERSSANMAQKTENPYYPHFQEYITVNNTTNLCISYAKNPIATVYNFHGLWGSPIEDWMRNTFQTLLDNNFNIVSIETTPLSVTAKQKIEPNGYLETLRKSIEDGLIACKEIDKLNNVQYNIANPHSMACRALIDLMFEKPKICRKFNTTIFNNPYFMPPERLCLMSKSKVWEKLKDRSHTDKNTIDNVDYKTVSVAKHLLIKPIDAKIQKVQDANDLRLLIKMITARIFKLNPSLQIKFIQGAGDDSTINRNEKIFENLNKYKKVKVERIPDANHTFSNTLEEYTEFFIKIISSLNIKQI